MFGLTPRWIGIPKRKKRVHEPKRHPFDTCRCFLEFVKNNSELSDAELANKAIGLASPTKMGFYDVLDLVRATRDALPEQTC